MTSFAATVKYRRKAFDLSPALWQRRRDLDREAHMCWFTPRRAGLAALLLAALVPGPALAGVREDLRACQSGYLKTLTKGAPPPRTSKPDEQYCVGLAFWFQPSPLPRDPARAAQWYAAAADQGHGGAMVALGYQLEKGQGVNQNAEKAFQLYERAAGLGSPDAMFNVFRLYTTGKGVKADPARARAWLEKAAAAGSVDARKELAVIARGAREAPGRDLMVAAFAAHGKKDYATSARLYREAADLGNADAAVAAGQHYAQGLGVGGTSRRPRASSAWRRKRAAPPVRPS